MVSVTLAQWRRWRPNVLGKLELKIDTVTHFHLLEKKELLFKYDLKRDIVFLVALLPGFTMAYPFVLLLWAVAEIWTITLGCKLPMCRLDYSVWRHKMLDVHFLFHIEMIKSSCELWINCKIIPNTTYYLKNACKTLMRREIISKERKIARSDEYSSYWKK